MSEVSAHIDSATIVKTASFLLNHRRLSGSEQSFLINVSARASRADAGYRMTEREEEFWDTILDTHDQALIDAGLVAAWPLPGHDGSHT